MGRLKVGSVAWGTEEQLEGWGGFQVRRALTEHLEQHLELLEVEHLCASTLFG